MSRVALGAHAVGPARSGVLVMNPWSGRGKVGRFALVDEAHRRGIRPIVLQRGDDLRELAEAAVAAGADVIGMAGGDGSQALVADVARRHDVPFVCVPADTRNHFALDLGLDRDDVAAALDAYGPAVERRIDLAEVAGRAFVNNASIGPYATVVQSEEYRDAKLATVVRLFSRPARSRRPSGRPPLLGRGRDHRTACRHRARLQRRVPPRPPRPPRRIRSKERLDGDTLGVVTVTVDRARDVPVLLAAEAAGRVASFSGYREWTAPEFDLDSGEPLIDVGVDGEALRLAPPLEFRSLPGALRVRTPVDRPGEAPGLRPGHDSAVPALLRVLAGHPDR